MDLETIRRSLNKDGIFYRNPTHLDIADKVLSQSEIVAAISDNRRTRRHEVLKYTEEDESKYMPGTKLIRSMSRDQIQDYFSTLLRLRPNIFMIRLSLGNYPSMMENRSRKIDLIGSTRPREHKVTASEIADLFEKSNIVEFVYMVESAEVGKFRSRAFAFETIDEEYKDDKLFNPILEIEYFL